MGKVILRITKWKRPVSISLSDEYVEFLEKQPNRSEFIRKLLDKAMEEQKIKEKVEEKKIDLEGHPFTEDEVKLAAHLYCEMVAEEYLSWGQKTIREWSLNDWWWMFKEEKRLDLWGKLIGAVKEKIPQYKISVEQSFSPHEIDNTPKEVIDEMIRLFEPLEQVAGVLWEQKWREQYDKAIVRDLTLDQICRMLDERGTFRLLKTMSIKELARLLNLNYQEAYRILPLLEEEFGTLIKN